MTDERPAEDLPRNETTSELPQLTVEARDLAIEELKFHHDRQAAGSDVVTTIGQNIFILVGAGLVAATQVQEALVFVPLFWSAWLLHSLQRARDTIKHQVYARTLESLLNEAVKTPILVWSRTLTSGRLSSTPASMANFAYWGLLNLASWIIGIVVLFDHKHTLLAYLLIAACVSVYGIAGYTFLTNSNFEEECQRAILSDLRTVANWTPRYGKKSRTLWAPAQGSVPPRQDGGVAP
ncbi:hypothetical protein [Blastococcus sp. URHD0036]|uniref:hypothetical protein n=1 Tax=Blastococcus sp. URHD0036 TaxID=1380356 RepID=UPI0012DF12B1|nr:hypothetical protein [Blastococcus sp. URHD0036]